LREYLAAGLPVVATAIPEAARLKGLLHTAATYEQFLQKIDDLLARGVCGPQTSISRGIESESWDEKVRQMVEAASPFIPPAKTKQAGKSAVVNVQEICPGNF